MAESLEILMVSGINPKSFDVKINSIFLPDDVIEVTSLTEPDKQMSFYVATNSYNPSDDTRTVVLNTGSELISGYRYKVNILRGNESESYEFNYVTFPAMIDCKIQTYGDRIIQIGFPYPVKNLDKIHSIAEPYLENFYAVYYNRDTNSSNTADPTWVGNFKGSAGFAIRLSQDQRSIELQSTYKGYPLGNHGMTINYSKHQENMIDPNVILVDYYTPPRDIPIMEKPFTVSKSDTPAEAIDLIVLSRREVIVVYDKPVLLRDLTSMNVISSRGIPLNANKIERVGSTFNQLYYYFDIGTILDVGTNIPITVGSIIDANGYNTLERTFLRNVQSVKPKFLSVVQKEDISTPNTTELELTFSQEMLMTGTQNAADNKTNYIVSDVLNNTKNIISVTSIDAYKVLMVTEKLDPGYSFVKAMDIVNLLNESIDTTTLRVLIEDYTEPDVVEIIATTPVGANMTEDTNALIIKFDEPMMITGRNSYVSYLNYRLDYDNGTIEAKYELPSDTIVTAMKGDKWVRFELPAATNVYPAFSTTDYDINIGFTKVKDIRLVQNATGNYYPLCKTQKIDALIAPLSIVDGSMQVISDSILRFTYTGTNSFYNSVNKADFIIKLDGNIITANAISLVGDTVLEFSFPTNTFTSSSYNITIETKIQSELGTKDIFNKPILGGVTNLGPAQNKVKSILKGVSIANIGRVIGTNTTAAIALKFNQRIISIAKEDFRVVINNGLPCDILDATINLIHNDTIELLCSIPPSTNFTTAIFSVSVARSEALLQTIDVNLNPIPIFNGKNTKNLWVNTFKWISTTNTFGSSVFEMVFNKTIDFTTLDAGFASNNTVTLGSFTPTSNPTITNLPLGAEFGQIAIATQSTLLATPSAITTAIATKVNDVTLRISINDASYTDSLNPAVFAIYIPVDYTIMDGTNALYINSSYQPVAIPSNTP